MRRYRAATPHENTSKRSAAARKTSLGDSEVNPWIATRPPYSIQASTAGEQLYDIVINARDWDADVELSGVIGDVGDRASRSSMPGA